MSIIKGTNQIVAGFGGTKRSIGEVYFSQSALATDNSGALPLFTGETIASANTIYPEFYNWVTSHTELQCTSAEYESALTTYGECAKYVIGSGSLRLPLIKNYIKAANTSEGIKNIEAGLPNIIGEIGLNTGSRVSGSFATMTRGSSFNLNGTAVTNTEGIDFNASRSSAVYGKSSTVTPASTTLYPWVVAYTAAIPASTAQAAEFQNALSGKADTNLGNLSTAGKALASGLGMPGSTYTEFAVGASHATYTADYDCWLFLQYNITTTNVGYVNVVQNNHTDQKVYNGEKYNSVYIFTPIKAGTFTINYANANFLQARLFHLKGQE